MRDYVNKLKFKNQFIVVTITTFVFAILYHSAILGNDTNMYMDIGGDSINLSYPKLYLNSMISQGYILNNGLGQYMPGTWFTMLQPINLVRLFVKDIITANLIVLYIENIVTAIFAYMFFKKHITTAVVSVFGSVLWTYSGYMVLWGQHGFNMPLTYFTCAMYFLQCMLNKEKKGIFAIIPLTILAINSYYFFYMTGLFMGLYIVGYCIIKKYTVKYTLKEIFNLFLMGIASIGMGAVGLLPSLRTFLVSARTSVSEQKSYGILNNTQYMFSVVGRLLSNDIFGVGNSYTGYYNYYESAMLVCSALLIPCLVIMIRSRIYRKPTITLLLISIVLLCTPVTSYIFNFDARKPRWTYMLILLMVLCIVYCIDAMIKGILSITRVDIYIISTVYIMLFAVLLWGDRSGIADVKRMPFLMAVIFTIFYILSMLIVSKKHKYSMLALLIIIEVILSNYQSVNNRISITRQMLDTGLYNDGTEKILEYIDDNELYRVNKTYESVFFNDAMVQGYNGLGIYNPTNSKWLIDYYQSLGYGLFNGKIHCVRIGTNESVYNTLLGVKYIVAREGDVVPDNYIRTYSLGDKVLYYNEQSLGFGYIYTDYVSKVQYDSASIDDKAKILTNCYYITDNTDGINEGLMDVDSIDTDKSLDELKGNSAYNVSIEGNVLKLSIDVPDEDILMLCIPVIYDNDWKVYIDDKNVNTTNINGGLIGVDISDCSSGKHEVKLYYDAKEYRYGILISISSLILFLIVCYFIFRRDRNAR